MLNYFDIKPVLITIKNPQANALVERLRQVILIIIVTKYLSNKVFDYIDPWGETLSYTSWEIRASYKCTVKTTPGQYIFGRDMIFNLASFVDWKVITAGKN